MGRDETNRPDDMMDYASATPLPGSDAALEAGCKCPVIDNGRGNLSLARDRGGWIFTVGCPIHDPDGLP
jgi:hypothetical protein